MQITFTPEELQKHEKAVKEHIGRKFQHFVECFSNHWDPLATRQELARRALEAHKKFEGKYPTISSTLGLD